MKKVADSVAERLRNAREVQNLSRSKAVAFFERLDYDFSTKSLQNWENGDREPRKVDLETLAELLERRAEIGEEGVLREEKSGEPSSGLTTGSGETETAMVMVRHFGRAGAGPGRTPDLQVERHVELTRADYTLSFGTRDPDDVGFFEVEGDSAAPEYFDGEDVPVEVMGDTEEFRDDGKYVYRYRNDAQLKRLRRINGNQVEARSLNPGISLQILKPTENEFEILGRVIETPKQQLYGALVGRFLRMGERGQDIAEKF